MFDIHQSCADEFGSPDFDRQDEFKEGLLEDFVQSPEGKARLKDQSWPGWTELFLDYYFNYLGSSLPEMSIRDVEEVLFQLFPEKVSCEPEEAAEIISELHAFWSYLDREFHLQKAPMILAYLNDDAITELRAELANPRNFGMAKTFFALGKEAGFDMTTQESLDAFQLAYNSRILDGMNSLIQKPNPFEPKDSFFQNVPLLPGSNKSRKHERKKKKQQRQARKRNRR